MLEGNTFETRETLSRRDFLVKAGALTAGMAVAGAFIGTKAAESHTINSPIEMNKIVDLEAVRQDGYNIYWLNGGCCIGAAKSLLKNIRAAGSHDDWKQIPDEMFTFGAGGIGSWGTLCGALNGSLYVMQLAMGYNTTFIKAANELIGWYTRNSFPSGLTNGYKIPYGIKDSAGNVIPKGTFPVEANIYELAGNKIRASVAYSPLCHNSVSRWCHTHTLTVDSPEKKDRCAKLTGDVAAKAALILNQWKSGKLRALYLNAKESNYCMSCHSPGTVNKGSKAQADGAAFRKDDAQGKMLCQECHSGEHATAYNSADIHSYTQDCIVCHDVKK